MGCKNGVCGLRRPAPQPARPAARPAVNSDRRRPPVAQPQPVQRPIAQQLNPQWVTQQSMQPIANRPVYKVPVPQQQQPQQQMPQQNK
jgi:hypothetical protein